MNRQRHQPPKNLEERRKYIATVIRVPGPTSEDKAPFIDTTDHAVFPKERSALTIPTKAPSALHRFLREKWVELTVGAVLIPLLSAGVYLIFILNREVGEIHAGFGNLKTGQMNADLKLEKLEEKLSNRVGSLERRIDALFDRRPASEPSPIRNKR